MGDLKDIKDATPNPKLITQLESLLESAKEGRLRSMIATLAWDNNSVSHCWFLDKRCYRRMMLAELMMTQQDLATHIGLDEDDSVLANELNGAE